MKPYYEHAGVTIYHGDCREFVPKWTPLDCVAPFDLMLADPPYGIGEARGKNKSRGELATPKDYGFSGWDDTAPEAETLAACIAAGTRSVVWGGNHMGSLPRSSCWLVWDKVNGNTDFADCELAWTNYPGAVRMIRHQWNGMLRKGREKRWHPTQKPLEVIRWAMLMDKYGTSVLDPFMGSGTTLVAAKQLGRKAIGIELEERYCEIAAERLSQDVLPLFEASR